LETLEEQIQRLSSKPDTEEEAIKFDYDKPAESISAIVDRTIDKREKQGKQESQRLLFDKVSRAHKDGFTAAQAAYPKLFEGIESDVNDNVFAAMNPYVLQGHDVSGELGKQETWVKVAKYLRVDRGELDYLKGDTIEPVATDLTERPQSGSSAGTKRSPKSLLTPQVRKMMRDMNISEEDALALAKEVQDEERGKK
jgi:hypothetical protein